MPNRPRPFLLAAPLHVVICFLLVFGLRAAWSQDDGDEETKAKSPEAKMARRAKEFAEKIRPIMEGHCFGCHNAENSKGGLDLAAFKTYDDVLNDPDPWTGVFERVQADEMPPKKQSKISFGERSALMAWSRKLQPKELDCTKLASDRTENFYLGNVMSRRLNRDEYLNTLRDLLGLDVTPGLSLPADGAGGEGFDTTGETLFTSPLTLEAYLDSAERALLAVLPANGHAASPEQAAARDALLGDRPSDALSPRDAMDGLLRRFLRRAFRRPVEDADVQRYLAAFDRAFNRGDGYEASVRLALTGVLSSPHFLFLVEPEPAQGDIQPLGSFPLASRLSYFLWSTMPDEELFRAAESGSLLEPEEYLAQVRRMIRHPKAQALGERFAKQWLDIDRLGGDVRPDAGRFPEFDDALAASMRHEVVAYFNHLVTEDRPLTELLDSDYTVIDARLAAHYGIEGVQGDEFRRVTLNSRERGGVTGMAAVHAITSFPLRTSPVLRGRWILEALLGERVPPPPPDVPALPKDERDAPAADLREQLQRHRADANCASCHDRMDPLGFSMESFDNLGRFRTAVAGKPIDVSATLPGGEEFSGPAGLKKILLDRRDQIFRHLTRKLTGYALGRPLNRFDECVINDGMAALGSHEYHPSVLIETIATSKPFRYRYYAKPETAEGNRP